MKKTIYKYATWIWDFVPGTQWLMQPIRDWAWKYEDWNEKSYTK